MLGFPLTGELSTPDKRGRFNHFEGGSIYWTPQTGAHEVHGAIRHRWSVMGWERSFLGYPVTSETTTPDGRGRFNHFEGGSIYWTPETWSHEVRAPIRDLWAAQGWETGPLGYPTSDEVSGADGQTVGTRFQGGAVLWRRGRAAWLEHEHMRLVIDEIICETTTEHGVFNTNDRDEIYLLSSGGVVAALHGYALPASRTDERQRDPSKEDYIGFWDGTAHHGFELSRFSLAEGETCVASCVLREQDNAQLQPMLDAAEGLGTWAVGYFGGVPELQKMGTDKLKEAGRRFVASLGADGDQNIGAFTVAVERSPAGRAYKWVPGDDTVLESFDRRTAVFVSHGAGARYRYRATVW